MNRLMYFAAIVIYFVLGFGVHQSLAQAFNFNLGYSSGISTDATNLSQGSSSSRWMIERKSAYLVGLHFRSFLEPENRSRLGIELYFQTAKSKPVDPQKENNALRAGIRWKMFSMLLSYQRKIYHRNSSLFLSGFSGGFSFFSSSLISGFDYCDSPFCNLPDVRVNVGPALIYMLRVYETFALQIGGRYNLLMGENQGGSPFNSGLLLAVGLALEAQRR